MNYTLKTNHVCASSRMFVRYKHLSLSTLNRERIGQKTWEIAPCTRSLIPGFRRRCAHAQSRASVTFCSSRSLHIESFCFFYVRRRNHSKCTHNEVQDVTRHGREFHISNMLRHYCRLVCSYSHVGNCITLIVVNCNLCAVYTKALLYALVVCLKEWSWTKGV